MMLIIGLLQGFFCSKDSVTKNFTKNIGLTQVLNNDFPQCKRKFAQHDHYHKPIRCTKTSLRYTSGTPLSNKATLGGTDIPHASAINKY